MKTQYAHEAEAPFLANWPDCDPEIDWHLGRVLVELDEHEKIYPEALAWLVSQYGAENIDIEAFEYPGCGPRLRIIARLED